MFSDRVVLRNDRWAFLHVGLDSLALTRLVGMRGTACNATWFNGRLFFCSVHFDRCMIQSVEELKSDGDTCNTLYSYMSCYAKGWNTCNHRHRKVNPPDRHAVASYNYIEATLYIMSHLLRNSKPHFCLIVSRMRQNYTERTRPPSTPFLEETYHYDRPQNRVSRLLHSWLAIYLPVLVLAHPQSIYQVTSTRLTYEIVTDLFKEFVWEHLISCSLYQGCGDLGNSLNIL